MLGSANDSLEPIGELLRKIRNEKLVAVETMTPEPPDTFVLDVAYQDRPEMHPHTLVFVGRMTCQEFFD